MKTLSTPFALFVVSCLALVSSCKKEDSGPANPTGATPITPSGYVMFNNHTYAPFLSGEYIDTANKSYGCSSVLHYQGDTLLVQILFNVMQPATGNHSFDPRRGKNIDMNFYSNTKNGSAINGVCSVTKENGKYQFVFTDIVMNDYQFGPFTISGSFQSP